MYGYICFPKLGGFCTSLTSSSDSKPSRCCKCKSLCCHCRFIRLIALFHHLSCPSSLTSLASTSHMTFQMLEFNCSRLMILATKFSESTEAMFWNRLFCRVFIVPLPIIPLLCLQAITEVASSRNDASQVPSAAVSTFISLISLTLLFSAVSQSFWRRGAKEYTS